MASLFTHIDNFLTLRNLAKTPSQKHTERLNVIVDIAQRVYPSKRNFMRNLAAKAIKFQRAAFPFQPEDYSVAKAMYDEYFKMPNHIPSYEHIVKEIEEEGCVYIVKFRDDAPVKGELFGSYYVNGTYSDPCIWKLLTPNDSGFRYNKEYLTAFRYATQAEIDQYEINQEKISNLEILKDQKQQEIWELQDQINKLEKFENQ
jgi:hypothetical protein